MGRQENLETYGFSKRNVHEDGTPHMPYSKRRRSERACCRLPRNLLPAKGKLKVRGYKEVFIYEYVNKKIHKIPYVLVGSIHSDEENVREYDDVKFDGEYHYIHIQLTLEERIECSKNPILIEQGLQNITHGWSRYEQKDSKIFGKDVHKSRFRIYGRAIPVILISLFDGIGGARFALNKMEEYNIISSFSSEKNRYAKKLVQKHFEKTIDLGQVEQITNSAVSKKILENYEYGQFQRKIYWDDEKVHFIIIAGPPCQDLSQANANEGITKGLHGKKSRLFFHVPRIINYLTEMVKDSHKYVHFIVENVEMSPSNEKAFSAFLNGVKTIKIDFGKTSSSSLMNRRRFYFTSFFSNESRNIGTKYVEFGLYDFLKAPNYCMHWAKREGKTLDNVLYQHYLDQFEFFNKDTQEKVSKYLPTLTGTNIENAVGQGPYWIRHKHRCGEEFRSPQDINEDLLGYDVGYTILSYSDKENYARKMGDSDGHLYSEKLEDKRHKLLGNTFMVFHIRYLLWHLYRRLNGGSEMLVKKFKSPQDLCMEQNFECFIPLLKKMNFEKLDSN